jgi:hypothetical protein
VSSSQFPRAPRNAGDVSSFSVWCETHNQWISVGRRNAKRRIRELRGKGRMREYECDVSLGGWHIGRRAPEAVPTPTEGQRDQP